LAERGHVDDPRRAHAEVLERAASAFTEDADAVRVVEHEPRVMSLAELEELRYRCDVAIHAEDGVAGDDLPRGRRGREQLRKRSHIRVRVHRHLATAQAGAIDEAGVV